MEMLERIRILLVKSDNISEAELARRLNTSPQNFNKKMRKDNFTVNELEQIANALDCTLRISFISNRTNEEL